MDQTIIVIFQALKSNAVPELSYKQVIKNKKLKVKKTVY